ncbi:ATP-binding protein, partial [Streptomyces sp. NPDC020667]
SPDGSHQAHMPPLAHPRRQGQRARGRGVSAHAFRGHRRAMARLLAGAAAGEVPRGVASVVLLSRRTADGLDRISFG